MEKPCEESVEDEVHDKKWKLKNITSEELAQAQALLYEGWWQTSSNHRMVARFPSDRTPLEAFIAAEKAASPNRENVAMRALNMGETSAGDYYLRCHAPPCDRQELGIAVWTAYKALGGRPYADRDFRRDYPSLELSYVLRSAIRFRAKAKLSEDQVMALRERYIAHLNAFKNDLGVEVEAVDVNGVTITNL